MTGCLVAMTQCSPGDFTFRHFVLIAGSADDLPALLTGNQATLEVGRALAFLKDDPPAWNSVRGALEEVFAHYAGRQGLELRNRRFLWSARND